MKNYMAKNKQILLIYIFLTTATLIVFWGVRNCDFVFYDDSIYVTENNQVQNGITLEGIRWAFMTVDAANWHPVTWISHMLDVQLFGLKPRWHHIMNLLFHVTNTLLLFFVLHRMTKARWESAFVAALFALHPLHVESVAWVAERKDVLSAFFWTLTVGAYCFYVERQRLRRYLLVVLFFALGLMAKPMLVTLPFVLLLLDYWPLNRLRQERSVNRVNPIINSPAFTNMQKGEEKENNIIPAGEEEREADTWAGSRFQWGLIRPLLWEKIPLFVLTLLSSTVTYLVQQKEGTVASFEMFPMGHRIANALVSYIAYIEKTIWPIDLAVLYPYPMTGLLPAWQVFGALFVLMAVTITVIWKAARAPYLTVGWLWYVGTLVPVIGIVQVGSQARADRYTYLPLIGFFIMVAWGFSQLFKNWRYRKETLFTLSAVILLCLCIVTRIQIGYWQDRITLFEHAIKVTNDNVAAHDILGSFYSDLGNYTQAIRNYDQAIEINPQYEKTYNLRGVVYSYIGNFKQAIKDYDQAIEINPQFEKAYNNRGIVYSYLGNNRQAISDFDKAIEIDPIDAEPYNNRGCAYWSLGKTEQAIGDLRRAARLGYKKAQEFLKSQDMGW